MPYYAERYGLEDGDFPNTLEQFERTVSLPIWPGMTKKQVARVIELAKSSADTVRL
jgi:dTDP-4-amino-4,6-dideoxygalactose transaminase